MINDKLFESEDFLLTAIDYEKDPEVDSQYSLNLRYAKYWSNSFIRPFSKNEFKKKYEKVEKRVSEKKNVIHFAVRKKVDHNLIGFIRINVLWNHAVGWLVMAIGNSEFYLKAEQQLVPLILKYAFYELNLYRIEVDVPEYECDLGQILLENGFTLDGTSRGVLFFENKYWNESLYGILKPEWEASQEVLA